ncbi:hypothetical protein [Altererythrobacter lutimaris]|uniref:Homeodomain phBC6A51-type domain-containing protein n=1 Tax=Altererythrobacter lutimaris TaxID=2743979 RepID=A0A850H9D5_9SPHN|nr:hypothetical protein [Altererythrobacter lutimaris]NVE94110.1 hypothetical protein [Altererythrobacter lutimaris]
MTHLVPVPLDQTRDNSQKKARFLERLSLTGNVRSACRAIAITPMTAYRWRRQCPHFASGWEAALVVARAHAEEVLADRALNGVEETVFYHGEEVATRTRYDARLLLAHLARLDAKAEDRNLAEAAADFDSVLAHFEAHGTLPPELGEARAGSSDEDIAGEIDAGEGGDAPPQEDVENLSCEERCARMERARPADSPTLEELAVEDYGVDDLRSDQLLAFEAGEDEWWLIGPPADWDYEAW